MDTWFRLKNDEWHPNPEDWAAHADDNHETLTPRADIPKLQHVQELAEERKLYGENGGSGRLRCPVHAHVRFRQCGDHAGVSGTQSLRETDQLEFACVSESWRRLENRVERANKYYVALIRRAQRLGASLFVQFKGWGFGFNDGRDVELQDPNSPTLAKAARMGAPRLRAISTGYSDGWAQVVVGRR